MLNKIVTDDESWVYGYDIEIKAQSSQWKICQKSQDRKKHVKFGQMFLLTVFFDCNGLVHLEFLPQDRTLNKEYYLKVMRRLRETIYQKRIELWKT